MAAPIIILAGLGAGGVAYGLTRKPTAAPKSTAPVVRRTAGASLAPGTAGLKNPYITAPVVSSVKPSNSQQQALAEAAKRMKADYDRLSAEAKRKGAALLNQQLGTNLKGTESFAEVSAALGGIAGNAVCGPLCGIAAGYLGKEIGDYLAGVWPDVKDWSKDKLGDAWGGVKDAASEVKNFLGSLW